jgi:hypothetical protein
MKLAFQDIEAPRSAAAYRDPRADGGQRDVTLTTLQVTIGRRLQGMRMKIRVPVRTYRGVAMGLDETAAGRLCFKVALRHQDNDLDVMLHETFDESEAMQMWRDWSEHLALSMMVEREDGALERIAPAPGAMQSYYRRRGAVATARSRGRFARRRRMGLPVAETAVHRDEREIIAYE